MRRILVLLAVAAVAAGALTGLASARGHDAMGPLVSVAKTNLGRVLVTHGKLGLYWWQTEKKAGGKIRCTGKCLAAWPAVYVPNGMRVPAHVKGVSGMFGKVRRANGRWQLTYENLPLYTYHGDTAGPAARIRATLYSDPGCPWAYSVNPALRTIEWRYGDALDWRLVLIGLAASSQEYVDRGYTPGGMAVGWTRYRRFGMPISPSVRPRVAGTARACRAVCAARSLRPGDEWTAFRALQMAWFTTEHVMDEDGAIASVLSAAGLDGAAIVSLLDDPAVTDAYERDRAEARTAAGSPAELQGKTVRTDGPVRFSAPSLVLERDGTRLVAGGFQTVQAYDVLAVNLGAGLERRQPPEGAAEALAAFPGGLTTQEVTALLVHGNDDPDRLAAEQALHALVAEGRAVRTPVGDDALWRAIP